MEQKAVRILLLPTPRSTASHNIVFTCIFKTHCISPCCKSRKQKDRSDIHTRYILVVKVYIHLMQFWPNILHSSLTTVNTPNKFKRLYANAKTSFTLHCTIQCTKKKKKIPIFIISTAYKCNNSSRTLHLAHVL